MSTLMIVLILVVLVVIAVSLMLGRISYEVESARDTEYVELEGHWVRYNVTGGGPPVLLVHGWLSSSRIWEPIVHRLAQRFTVYTLDLAGFGESDKPTDGYGVRYGSRLLYAFCAHFGLTRTTVVGHDFGGEMAVKLAADHPDIVGRLVLVATPADDEQIDLPTLLWLATLPVVGPVFYTLGRLLRPVRRLWARPFVFNPADLPDSLVEDAGRSTPAAAARTFNAVRHEISGGRLTRQSRIIKVPILLVAGEDDQIVDPRAVSDWGQNAAQAEIWLLSGCGHLPMVEFPSEFGARLMAFLTGDTGYLEYVREVPAPAAEDPAREEPEQTEATEPEPPAASPETPRAAERASFGDLVWDFTPGKSPPRRGDGTPGESPEPEATPAPEYEGWRPASGSSGSRKMPPDGEPAREDSGDEGRRAPRPRDETRQPTGGSVPEFPGDLFQWSEPPGEFSPGRRSRRKRLSGDDESSGGRG